METWRLYYSDCQKSDKTMIRGEKVPDGYFHIAVLAVLFDNDGKMLIQKRSEICEKWSGLWDMSAGGSAIGDESPQEALAREMREELGIEYGTENIRPQLIIPSCDCYLHLFIINMDTRPSVIFRDGEVTEVKWVDKEELLALIDTEKFIPYHKEYIHLIYHLRDGLGLRGTNDGIFKKNPGV